MSSITDHAPPGLNMGWVFGCLLFEIDSKTKAFNGMSILDQRPMIRTSSAPNELMRPDEWSLQITVDEKTKHKEAHIQFAKPLKLIEILCQNCLKKYEFWFREDFLRWGTFFEKVCFSKGKFRDEKCYRYEYMWTHSYLVCTVWLISRTGKDRTGQEWTK